MPRYLSLSLFLLISLGGGLLIGALNIPGAWYAGLGKPPGTPPGWVFGPAWTFLYILIGFAGWRIATFTPRGVRGLAFRFWALQMVLNFIWSPIVFSLHRLDIGLAVILTLLAVIIGFLATSWRTDRIAAILFIPYLIWVSFASYLNTGLVVLNGSGS